MLKYSYGNEVIVLIVYSKLQALLDSKGMKFNDFKDALGLSPTIAAKFSKNRSMNTETIDKVCEYFQCQPGDIMEWLSDEEYEKRNADKIAIEKQIADLKKQLKTM